MGIATPIRFVSRLTRRRALWGGVAILGSGAIAVAAVLAAITEQSVPSIVLAAIVVALALMAGVLAIDGVSQGVLRVNSDGYATHLTGLHPWHSVLALGTATVEGRRLPTVALRSIDGFVVEQDLLRGFADDEGEAVLDVLDQHAPPLPGFGDVVLDAAWWATVEAEAERAIGVVRESAAREPISRERVPFGFPGLTSAIRLDYGTNLAGERVELIVRQGLDLALTTQDRRWLRQHRRRSPDAATQVAPLFGEHQVKLRPDRGTGFDRITVSLPDQRPLTFNAEEPDRYRAA